MSNYKENAEFVKRFLDETDWHYDMSDHEKAMVFTGGLGGFGGMYNSFKFLMVVGEDEAQTYVMFPVSAPKDKLQQMAEFVIRANYGLRYGGLEMDFTDGEIRFHMTLPMQAIFAERELIVVLLGLPAKELHRYSRGITEVLMGLKSPEEAVKECES